MGTAEAEIDLLEIGDHSLRRLDASDPKLSHIGADELQEKEQDSFFQTSLQMQRAELHRSEVSWNREFGEIQEPRQAVIRFMTPVFAEDGRRLGLIAINILAVPFTTNSMENANTQRGIILSDGVNNSFHYSSETGVGEIYLERSAPISDAFQEALQEPHGMTGVSNQSGQHIAWNRSAYLNPFGEGGLIAVTTPSDNFNRQARGASTILLSGIYFIHPRNDRLLL